MRYAQICYGNLRGTRAFHEDPCPAVLVEVVGPSLRISALSSAPDGAGGITRVLAEPLTPFLHVLRVPQPSYQRQLLAALHSLDVLVKELAAHYLQLPVGDMPHVPHRYGRGGSGSTSARGPRVCLPYPVSDPGVLSGVDVATVQQLDPKKLLYCAEHADHKQVLVKFVCGQYGEEVRCGRNIASSSRQKVCTICFCGSHWLYGQVPIHGYSFSVDKGKFL